MKTGAEDAKVADSMVEHLLSAGSLSFGGTMSGDRAGVGVKKDAQAKEKHAKHRHDRFPWQEVSICLELSWREAVVPV